GGGEPLLRPQEVRRAIRIGRKYFHETALFTNGSFLDRELALALAEDGLSYLCLSRHHFDDERNRALMGESGIGLEDFFNDLAGVLKVRATCVLCRGFIEETNDVWNYIRCLRGYGVNEFTFKHTYVAYRNSIFGASPQNNWAENHQVQTDPFLGQGQT